MISQGNAFIEAAQSARLTYLDTGASVARIRIYGTARPANGADPGGAALVEIFLDDPCGTVVSGTLELEATADALIFNTGIAVWARVVNANGDHAFDCDVSAEGGDGEVQLNTINLYAGGYVRLTSAVIG